MATQKAGTMDVIIAIVAIVAVILLVAYTTGTLDSWLFGKKG